MVKKILGLMIAVALMFSVFAGCSSTGGKNAASNQKAEDKGKVTASAVEEKKEEVKKEEVKKEEKKEPVKIKFMQNSANGGKEETLKSMIEDFQKKNPDVVVESEIVPWKDYFTKLNIVISSGSSAPDVFELGYENFGQYAAKGLLKELDEAIAKDKDFKPESIKKLAYDAYKFNGKQMGVCTDFSAVVLYYNKDLFDSKKVAYPQGNWTWKDELEAAKKLTDEGKGIWGSVSPLQAYEFYKTIAQNNGSIWGSDGKSVTVNSKECVDALQWMLDKSMKYKISPRFSSDIYTQPDADVNAFAAGKVAMLRTGIWNMVRFTKDAKFKWDIALEPGNTKPAHHFFSNGLVTSKDSKNVEAAWKFIKYMAIDPYVISQRIEKDWNVPVVNNDAIMTAYFKKTPPESKKVVTDTLDSLVLPPLGPIPDKWNEMTKILGDELDKAKFGKQSVQKSLDSAKEKIEKLVQK
ncbi:MAG: sugar ABC transporter substrate-binding protein [Clostridia bacterium]|nr:sugar ABC transporter substrate-binding protein [Clostridia bacterium]